LDENNFLLWSQQVNGVITAHNLHRFVVNPEIPLQYANVADRLDGKNSDEYQQWLFKDQSLFTWLLSTISDNVLPRVLSCKHSHEVWEKIHKYFNSVLKSRARQLRYELKNTKKLARSVNEYLLRMKSIVNSLIAVGDIVSEQEQVDAILEGLPEDFNSFVMMIYSRFETPTVEDVEALLLLQEVQFEKFRQELTNPSVSANVAQVNHSSNDSNLDAEAQESGTEHYNVNASRGRGRGKAKVEVVAVLKLLVTMVRVPVKSVLEIIMMLQYVGTGMSLNLPNPKLVVTIHTPIQGYLTSILMPDPLLT
jgi:histone deacetylase 1/2